MEQESHSMKLRDRSTLVPVTRNPKSKKIIYDSDEEPNYSIKRPRIASDSSSDESEYGQDDFLSTVLKIPLEKESKSRIIQLAKDYQEGEMDSSDRYKIKKYLQGIIKIPFGKYSSEHLNCDSLDKKRTFLHKIRKNMNQTILGQRYAKNSIIETIAKKLSNPSGLGNIIGLSGPPGVGKTSLIRDGLSKSYGVPFNFISLGGMGKGTGSLRGTDFSFIGSGWGRIVDILMRSGCMDPVIFFDELDKISISEDGLDIISCLIHLTDPSQNKEWEDGYYTGIPFDLSRATIIFSMNDPDLIPDVLKDRITIINMSGFDQKQKLEIAKKYSLPKIFKDIGFQKSKIIIPEDTIQMLIKRYCHEPGIRKLEKCLRTLIMKFNYFDMIELGKKEYDQFLPYKIDPYEARLILDQIF